MIVDKYFKNPIIEPGDVKPSRKGFEVIGAFNAGVTELDGETILILRVAERPINNDPDYIKVPFLDDDLKLKIKNISIKDPNYDFSDSRSIKRKGSSLDFEYLTSMSHLRIARSKDGKNFKIDEKPFIFPDNKYESFGIEDPRVSKIDSTYYINYSAVSKYGIVVMLSKTNDFKSVEKLGAIFTTENKDVALFPEKINGKYYALNRPVSSSIGKPSVWISQSSNLIEWGNHKILIEPRKENWDCKKVGAGAPPIKTDKGWLEFYHGVDNDEKYSMGAVLLDKNDPSKVIARTNMPIISPEKNYETKGFFGNVVFSCGIILKNDIIKMYYGVSDSSIAYAQFKLADVFNLLK